MPQNRLRLVAIAVVILIIAALLIFFRPISFSGTAPTPTFPPPPQITLTPPSLEALVGQFPQLERLLRDPDIDSIYKDFLIAYQSGGIEAAEQLARTRGLLTSNNEVRVTLILNTTDNARLIEDLESLGVRVLGSFQDMIDISIPLKVIIETAQSDDVTSLFERIGDLENVIGLQFNLPSSPQGRLIFQTDETILSEGVSVINAELWHAAGLSGRGLRIGILDQGFDGYAELLGRELPEQVSLRSFVPGVAANQTGEDHGTAVAEIVHDIAPGAELFLAYYDGGDVSMGSAVDWLLQQGVHIISHSAGGLASPMDGTGPDAELVDNAAAQGVLWVNSVGNSAEEHYRAIFLDDNGDALHDFSPSDSLLAFRPDPQGSTQIVLNWDDWPRSSEDYDLYVFDRDGVVLASSRNVQAGRHAPVEQIVYRFEDAGTYYVAIQATQTTRAHRLDLYIHEARSMQYTSASYSLATPADARGALSVGAAFYRDGLLQAYSSYGPTNDGRQKPELLGPDGVSVATYVSEPFLGTSVSAPHIAGAAALVWEAYTEFDADDVRDFLLSSTLGPSDDANGSGSLRLPAPPQVLLGERPAPIAPAAATLPSTSVGSSNALAGVCFIGIGAIAIISLLALRRRSAWQDTASISSGTTTCNECGLQVRSDAQFCNQCGRPIDTAASRACIQCGQRLRPGAAHCSHCGTVVQF